MTLLTPELLPTKTYPFQNLRYVFQTMGIQQGVFGSAADYLVAQRGAGANMTVDVPAGTAWITGTSITRQGIYHQTNDGTVNVGNFATADATNPRVDQVFLVVNDSSVIGGSDVPQFVIVTGVPTAGATIGIGGNRNGAVADGTIAASYPNRIRLADVLIPATATTVTTANIFDRRPKTRGHTNIATSEARTNTVYGLWTTPDQVTELVLPPDGLFRVGFQGDVQQAAAGVGAGKVAIFLNSTQLKQPDTPNNVQEVSPFNVGGVDSIICSALFGLTTVDPGGVFTSFAATGTTLGRSPESGSGSLCEIWAAAGTYHLSIQSKSTSLAMTAKQRKFWVFVVNPDLGMLA